MIEGEARWGSPRDSLIRQQGNQTDQSPHGGSSNTPESQPLPSVWDVLESRVRINEERSLGRMTSEAYDSERRKLNRLAAEIEERATSRDALILDLYDEVRYEPATLRVGARFRRLSREEFQQFRSKVEPMSDEELAEELRKQEKENDGLCKLQPTPPSLTCGLPSLPNDLDDEIF
jgi:hypothetical protein